MPHAPLLLPELESPEVSDAAATIRRAVRGLPVDEAEVVLVASPHGSRSGVYRSARGTLAAMGLPNLGFDDGDGHAPGLPFDGEILESPADFGVLVPLMLMGPRGGVVGLAFRDEPIGHAGATIGSVRATASKFAAYVEEVAATRSVLVIASAHTGAGLSDRAPLTEIDDAAVAEQHLVDAISVDSGALQDEALLDELRRAGVCGIGPLALLGELFGGRPMVVLAREAPVGVGYLVAATS